MVAVNYHLLRAIQLGTDLLVLRSLSNLSPEKALWSMIGDRIFHPQICHFDIRII